MITNVVNYDISCQHNFVTMLHIYYRLISRIVYLTKYKPYQLLLQVLSRSSQGVGEPYLQKRLSMVKSLHDKLINTDGIH